MTNINNPEPPSEPVVEPDDVTRGENAIELKEVEGLSQGQIVRRRFFNHKAAVVSMVVLGLIVVLAFSSVGFEFLGLKVPGWWRWGYMQQPDITNGGKPTMHLPWSAEGFAIGEHPFGQDTIGRDIFALTMKGIQTSIVVMLAIGVVALALGLVFGALSGYFRGWVDTLLMRATDLVITLPTIAIAAVLGVIFQHPAPVILGIVLGLISWTGLARLVRGDFLSLREREFVDAARVAGASNARIIFKHILPNAMGVIIVNTTLLMSSAVLLETALSYLGFGIQEPNVSLGTMISTYQNAFSTRPWLFWWPGLFIILIALCINFIGDGLRDAFDPRQKRVPSWRARRKADATRAAAMGGESA